MQNRLSQYTIRLLEKIQECYSLSQCWIFLHDPLHDLLPIDLEYRKETGIRTAMDYDSPDLAKKIFYEKTPVVSNQIIHDCRRWALNSYICGRSLLNRPFIGVPIHLRSTIIGVVAFQSDNAEPVGEIDGRLAQLIADHWAAECENEILREENRQRINKSENLYRLSTQLMSAQESSPLFSMIIQAAIQTVPQAEKGTLLLFNPKNQKLEVLAHYGYSDDYIQRFTLEIGQGYSGIAFQEQRDLLIADMDHPDAARFQIASISGNIGKIRSAITALLKYKNRTIGTISLENFSTKDAFQEEDLRQLSLFASQAAILIENVRLLESLRKHSIELEVLYDFSSRLIGRQHPHEVLQDTLTAALQVISGSERGYILHRDQTTGSWNIPYYRGIPSEKIPELTRCVGASYIGWAVSNRQPGLYTEENTEYYNILSTLKAVYPLPVQSAVVSFFIVDDYIAGVLVLESSLSAGAFTDKDIKLCTTMTSQASSALQNMKWLTTLEHRVDDRTRQLRELNRRILETDRLKSQFLSNISHELRTPLNAVIGFSELLLDKVLGDLNNDQQECLEDIHASGKHLLNIINDILDLSKIQAGKMELFMEDFLLSDAISSIERSITPIIRNKEQKIITRIPPGLPMVHADIKKFKQILHNLISNAAKYSPPQSVIEIEANRIDDDGMEWIEVSVIDHGKGIRKEHQEIIFDEFRQVDGSHTREDSGTGLGLALCRHLVELQGGKIWVNSEPGKGSRFSFRIPIETALTLEGAGAESAKTNKSKRVLVVEDDSISAGFLKKFMEMEGFEVHVVHLGEYVVAEARRIQPLVITLDIMLPGINGWQVLQDLKNDPQTAHIPVLIVSATDDDHVYRVHAHDYFVKPVERDKLLARIRELSELSKLSREIKTILIVDDDKGFLTVTSTLLERQGFTTYKATSGPEALEWLKTIRPDVILLDLLMPGMNGVEVIEQIKQNPNTQHLPIIILTAANLTKKDTRTLEGKIQGMIEKTSYQPEDLASEIRRIIH